MCPPDKPRHRRRRISVAHAEGRRIVSAPLPADSGLAKRRELLSGVWDRAPAGNAFWRVLKASERSFCTYMLKYLGARPRFRGNCPSPAPS